MKQSFKRKVNQTGRKLGTKYITIPVEIVRELGIKNGQTLTIKLDSSGKKIIIRQ